jgi:hypothetical protein
LKKVWIAALLFSQVFFIVVSVRVLASVLATIIGGQVKVGYSFVSFLLSTKNGFEKRGHRSIHNKLSRI